jgi:hypothetical protein
MHAESCCQRYTIVALMQGFVAIQCEFGATAFTSEMEEKAEAARAPSAVSAFSALKAVIDSGTPGPPVTISESRLE